MFYDKLYQTFNFIYMHAMMQEKKSTQLAL